LGQRRNSFARAGEPRDGFHGAAGKSEHGTVSGVVAQVEEISGMSTGFRPKGTLEALFSHDTKAELSTIIALHHGLGLKAEPLRAEDARELEPS